MSAGLQPLIHGALGVAGGGQMMRQEFRLALDEIGEISFQHRRGAGVQFLAPAAQQGAVGGVLHQRVLEQIGGVRRRPAAEQQPGLGQPVEPRTQLRARPPAPPARSGRSRTRGRCTAPICPISLATGPSRSRRAISEACKVAGIGSAGSGLAPAPRRPGCRDAPVSSTALVISSTNSGTPSVRSTISSTISRERPALPASRCDQCGAVAVRRAGSAPAS